MPKKFVRCLGAGVGPVIEIDVGNSSEDVIDGINRATDPTFRKSLHGLQNPYGTGCAVLRIVEKLKSVAIDDRLTQKRFHDLFLSANYSLSGDRCLSSQV